MITVQPNVAFASAWQQERGSIAILVSCSDVGTDASWENFSSFSVKEFRINLMPGIRIGCWTLFCGLVLEEVPSEQRLVTSVTLHMQIEELFRSHCPQSTVARWYCVLLVLEFPIR